MSNSVLRQLLEETQPSLDAFSADYCDRIRRTITKPAQAQRQNTGIFCFKLLGQTTRLLAKTPSKSAISDAILECMLLALEGSYELEKYLVSSGPKSILKSLDIERSHYQLLHILLDRRTSTQASLLDLF